ncbi:MAG TPA: hypothetical protein VGO58_01605 [Chitinophagaceae bacterium]|jgi:hypothetical protein|nr:hypothetical protein [Chitinophagaceae bacterium]
MNLRENEYLGTKLKTKENCLFHLSYTFKFKKEKMHTRVFFMSEMISLGWQAFATFGNHHPGGWATKDAIFCVKSVYDLKNESFLVSYLAHEGRHFSDLNRFPKLKNTDLEYRAKLTELSIADKTLLNLIEFFIVNAYYRSANGHSAANYYLIGICRRNYLV